MVRRSKVLPEMRQLLFSAPSATLREKVFRIQGFTRDHAVAFLRALCVFARDGVQGSRFYQRYIFALSSPALVEFDNNVETPRILMHYEQIKKE